MQKIEHTNYYMPSALRERLESPAYMLAQYQKPESEVKQNIMSDFLEFVEDNFELSKTEKKNLKILVTEFIGFDYQKIQQAELNKLAAWKKSVTGA